MAGKRGRKRKNDLYFGPEQEEAVIKFLSLGKMIPHPDFPDDDKNPMIWFGTEEEALERDVIYRTYLREPLNKMCESIIRKYRLYRKGMSFEETHNDALSFLMTKKHKFDKEEGKKSYSYYGT
ncbi:MAG: hypothetical protein GTO02_17810, partial [Candidatus Dadabacteria bacterium]|nr:hypothetical protein [Candidatus Dadabacteria bacterium]